MEQEYILEVTSKGEYTLAGSEPSSYKLDFHKKVFESSVSEILNITDDEKIERFSNDALQLLGESLSVAGLLEEGDQFNLQQSIDCKVHIIH